MHLAAFLVGLAILVAVGVLKYRYTCLLEEIQILSRRLRVLEEHSHWHATQAAIDAWAQGLSQPLSFDPPVGGTVPTHPQPQASHENSTTRKGRDPHHPDL